MQVKIDTREKFHAITIQESHLTANMTAALDDCLLPFLQNDVKNLVVIFKEVETVDESTAEYLVKLQQTFYEQHASFVICEMQPALEEQLDKMELLELLNVTPTESEAWDILHMEEIERELLRDDE